jgi:hypothetical protein
MFLLRHPDGVLAAVPVDVAPCQLLKFARDSEAAVPSQGDQESPVVVRAGREILLDHLSIDEVLPLGVLLASGLDLGERIVRREVMILGILEELSGPDRARSH